MGRTPYKVIMLYLGVTDYSNCLSNFSSKSVLLPIKEFLISFIWRYSVLMSIAMHELFHILIISSYRTVSEIHYSL